MASIPTEINIVTEVKSELLKEILTKIPQVSKIVHQFLAQIDADAALNDDKGNLFLDEEQFPKIISCKKVLFHILQLTF